CGVIADQLVAAVGHEELTPAVQWLAVDPAGRLWVTRSTDGITPHHVDILDADGRYLGTMDAPGMPVAFVSPTVFAALAIRPEPRGTGRPPYELRARDGAGSCPRGVPRPQWLGGQTGGHVRRAARSAGRVSGPARPRSR